MDGFFLINKEQNMSSHSVVASIKKKFNFKKVGHTGTLDPFACGLLIVLVNNATKLAFLFENLDKTYEGVMLFHEKYDTLDITGKLLERKENNLSQKIVQESFDCFHQKIYFQKPPMYSAIKIKGKKMYNLARQNIHVDIPSRKVHIYDLKILSNLNQNKICFKTRVSKGTYVRSLARDIGYSMNTYGALQNLTRTKIGFYDLFFAKTIFSISLKDLISPKELFQNYSKIVLNDYLIQLVKHGIYLDERQIITHDPFIVLDKNQNWIAYYEPCVNKKNQYYPKYFF
ncbi:tRNA pseudouridine(55) synthase TruB [Candidatus Phytoplasma pini]|uniref:tRNA pseudouridine(55) synthase TruB n=1 Tax=Candidatus Phytoplasma pini TaxID=267362 RepID=UPI0011A5E861|nr:tRNA pseudouridine(55) synthase TruB [Candidatus Phytoplasma pini]